MNHKNVFLSISGEAAEEDFISSRPGINTEAAGYALPEVLDAPGAMAKAQAAGDYFRQNKLRVGMHGPVLDLHYESRDIRVREVARDRILQGLEIAEQLGAEFMVAHSNFNSLQVGPKYYASWLARTVEFWKIMAAVAEKKKVRIVFENIWDSRPEMIKDVIERVGSLYFRACLDTGHFNIFSSVSIEDWVAVWGKDLTHLHLHNNFGQYDEHNGFDKGTFNFSPFFAAMQKHGVSPTMTVEVRHRMDAASSLNQLKELINKYGSGA